MVVTRPIVPHVRCPGRHNASRRVSPRPASVRSGSTAGVPATVSASTVPRHGGSVSGARSTTASSAGPSLIGSVKRTERPRAEQDGVGDGGSVVEGPDVGRPGGGAAATRGPGQGPALQGPAESGQPGSLDRLLRARGATPVLAGGQPQRRDLVETLRGQVGVDLGAEGGVVGDRLVGRPDNALRVGQVGRALGFGGLGRAGPGRTARHPDRCR